MPAEPTWEAAEVEDLYIAGPPAGTVYFGCKAWEAERERQSPLTCRVCGGLPAIDPDHPEWGAVPPSEYDPAEHVLVTPADDPLHESNGFCCGCSRWKRDEWLRMKLANAAAS